MSFRIWLEEAVGVVGEGGGGDSVGLAIALGAGARVGVGEDIGVGFIVFVQFLVLGSID